MRALRCRCQQHTEDEKAWTFTYSSRQFNKRYNGGGFKGTGGPKGDWFRHAVEEYLNEHYPELKMTLLMRYFKDEGWELVFTVPYWASSQPIEQVWAYEAPPP